MANSEENKRSIQNVLINQPLQREFTLAMLAIMMTAGFSVGFMIHLVLRDLAKGVPPTISRATFEQIVYDVNSQLVVGAILIIFIAVIITGFFGIFFLHRVAGPIYRFQVVLNRLGRGENIHEIKLRRRDFFPETADAVNLVIRLIRRQDAAIKDISDLLRRVPVENLDPELKGELDKLRKELKGLERTS